MRFLILNLENKLSRKLKFAFSFLIILSLSMIAAHLFSKLNMSEIKFQEQLKWPSFAHILGQDANGRDILLMILLGGSYSLIIAFCINVISFLIGTSLGMLSGYFDGKLISLFITFLTDSTFAFPGVLLSMAVTAITGPGIFNLIFAISISKWAGYARLAKSETLAISKMDYIIAARCYGSSDFRLLYKHIFPNIMTNMLIQAAFGMSSVIMIESSLSFLGLGLPTKLPSLGMLLSMGKDYIFEAPFIALFAGLFLMTIVFIFNLIGEGLSSLWQKDNSLREM